MLLPLRSFAFSRPCGRLARLLVLLPALAAPLLAQTSARTITATAGGASTSLSSTDDPSLAPPATVAAPLPDRDEDGDGLTYFEEMQRGSDPTKADTDGDGVPDPQDGWPRHDWITAPPLPETRYAVLPLNLLGWSSAYRPRSLTDDLQVIGHGYANYVSDTDYDPVILPSLGGSVKNLVTGSWYSHLMIPGSGSAEPPAPYPPNLQSIVGDLWWLWSPFSNVTDRYFFLLNQYKRRTGHENPATSYRIA